MTILAKVKIRFHGRSWAPLSRKQYDGRNGNGYQPRRENGPPHRNPTAPPPRGAAGGESPGAGASALFDLLLRASALCFILAGMIGGEMQSGILGSILLLAALVQDEIRDLRDDLKRRQDRDA